MAEKKSPLQLDLRGLKCPLPALYTRKALLAAKPGDVIEVVCNDPMAAIDIPSLVHQCGDRLLTSSDTENELNFVIERISEDK